MSHLKLLLTTSSIEVVASSTINKLYELALTSLDETSDVLGNLLVTHAYEDAVSYLLAKYTNLLINVTSGAYIRFADSAVAAICAANWGDGTGITVIQAAVITDLSNKFAGNTSIRTFNELKKFTNLKMSFNRTDFNGSSIKEIDLSNITNIGTLGNYYPFVFYNCTDLDTVIFSQNTESIGVQAFYNCTKFNSLLPTSIKYLAGGCFTNTAYSHDVNLPNLVDLIVELTNIPDELQYSLMDGWFALTKIERVTNLGSITRISRSEDNFYNGCFERCFYLKYVTLPATLLTLGCRTFYRDAALVYIRCLAVNPPTCQSSLIFDSTNDTFKIYVPDDSVSAYQSASYWSNYASRIFSLTQFATDFPNG